MPYNTGMLAQGGMGAPNGAADVNLPQPGSTAIPQLGGGTVQQNQPLMQGQPNGLQGPGASSQMPYGMPTRQLPGVMGMPGSPSYGGGQGGQLPGVMGMPGSPSIPPLQRQPMGLGAPGQQFPHPNPMGAPNWINRPMPNGQANGGMLAQGVQQPGGPADVNLPHPQPTVPGGFQQYPAQNHFGNYPASMSRFQRPGFQV